MAMDDNFGDWKAWCRLCGRGDQGNNRVCKPEISEEGVMQDTIFAIAIEKYFAINIDQNEALPRVLCTECFALVKSLDKFALRVARVQQMFEELHQKSEGGARVDYHALHQRYGLSEFRCPEVYLKPTKDLTKFCVSSGNKNMSVTTEALSENPLELPCLTIKNETDNIVLDDKDENVLMWDEEFDLGNAKEIDTMNTDDNLIVAKDLSKEKEKIHSKRKSKIKNTTITFACDECPRAYREKSKLKKHKEKYQSNEDYSIEETQFVMLQNQNALGKEQNEDSLTKNDYTEVMDDASRDAVEQRNTDAKIVCVECQMHFASRSGYGCHMRRIHSKTLKPLHFPCRKCTRVFIYKSLLERHFIMHKPLEVRKVLPCEFCARKFHSRFSLQRHMMIHTGKTPYKCDECPEAYREKCRLKEHKQKKHNPKESSTEMTFEEIYCESSTEMTFEEIYCESKLNLLKEDDVNVEPEVVNVFHEQEEAINENENKLLSTFNINPQNKNDKITKFHNEYLSKF